MLPTPVQHGHEHHAPPPATGGGQGEDGHEQHAPPATGGGQGEDEHASAGVGLAASAEFKIEEISKREFENLTGQALRLASTLGQAGVGFCICLLAHNAGTGGMIEKTVANVPSLGKVEYDNHTTSFKLQGEAVLQAVTGGDSGGVLPMTLQELRAVKKESALRPLLNRYLHLLDCVEREIFLVV